MMRLCHLTANLGNFDPIVPPVPQTLPEGLELTYVALTDHDFPPRRMTMLPRLQARIPKMFGWEMVPGFDAYLWLDASFSLQSPASVAHIWAALQGVDVVTFLHPRRTTIAEEADFLRLSVSEGCRYVVPRYAGELVEAQVAAIPPEYPDTVLYGTMLVAYWDRPHVRAMLQDWWLHTSRYHAVDQLAFPYVLWKHTCRVATLGRRPYNMPDVTFVRKHHR